MDLQSWEKVLLQWIHTFGFTKSNYITLEQTDIDSFFAYYVQKAQVEPVPVVEVALQAQPTQHLSPNEASPRQSTALQAFLGEMYPEFNGNLDGRGQLVGSDYLYIYSLLLHYKCVKQPSASFHSICKKLPVLAQSCICEFFQQTMNIHLTRENLSQAIANVSSMFLAPGAAEIKPFRATSSHSLDSDGSGHSSSLGEDASDLPIDFLGPISSPSPRTMPPPATPKTELLEQRTREVRGLQAQLEAERYEKNVLEEQILENEHLIKSLRKENKMKKLQLAKLKDSSENEDEDSIRKYVPNEFDHLKCSLMKEISQKEALITETRDKLQDLRIENAELRSKVKSSTEQLVVCMDRIRDLEVRQEEIAQTLATKTEQVDCLERDKQELEQCLQVTRDELHNRREVLNSSSDLLDLPMSPNTTPENLADSVIDKQLREKEHENLQLREELQELSKSLVAILEEHGLAVTDNSSQLSSSIGVVKEELTKSVRLIELRDSQLLEQSQLRDLALAQCEKLVEEGREHAKELDEIKAQYEQLRDQALAQCAKQVEEGRVHAKELEETKAEYEQKLASQLSSLKALEWENDEARLALKQATYESAQADEHLRQIKVQLAEKEEQMTQLGNEISELREKNKTLESRTDSLINERNSGVLQLHQEQRRQKYVRNKYAQCRDQLLAQSSDMDLLSRNLDASDRKDMLRRVDELIAAKEELRQQHEALKLEHKKTEQEALELKDRLQLGVELQQCVQQSHEQQQADLQQQLQVANERIEAMRQRNLQFVEQIQTDLNSQLHSSQQEVESFLSRITALVNGGQVVVKSEENGCQLSKFQQFESMLVSSLHQRSLEVQALQTKADQLLEKLDTVQRQNDSMLEAESQLKVSRINQLKLMASLEASAAKLRVTLNHKDGEIAAKNQQVAELQGQLASDQASSLLLKQLNDTIHNLEQVNEKLIDDNAKLESLHMEISSSLLTANGEVERLTNELSKCQTSLTEMTAADKLKATQLSESEKELLKLQDQLNEISSKYSDLEQHVDHLRTLKSDCEKRCQELVEKLAEKESQFSQLGMQHETQLDGLKAKLKDAQFNIEQQRQAILTDREEIYKYRAQLADLVKARDQSQEEMTKLRGLLSEEEKEKQEHLKTIKNLLGNEQQLTQKIDKLMGEHSEELHRLQAMLMEKQAVMAQLKTQLSSATELAQARAKQLTQAELAQVELAASLQSEKAMAEQLRVEEEEKSSAAYERIGKLEKLRDIQEHKARQLSDQLAEADQMKVSLNLEIGALNSDIEQRKRQMAEQASQLSAKQNEIAELESRLKSEVDQHKLVKVELEQITVKLAEVQQELNSTRLVQDTQHFELDEKTREMEMERADSAERVRFYQRRIDSLEGQLAEVQAASQTQEQAQGPTDLCTTYSKADCPAAASDDELVQLRQEMARSKLDCQILQAKYRETKEEIQRCEQKIKDQRLEMEGKLDKMKTKMDGPHSLDDSMCALLSSTGTGTRKKSIGTHYKRPGPPTPSKNGGRLSFGSSEPPREVLRDCSDHNSNSKTPARFKFLTTRFSVGSSGLPRDELPQRKRSTILTRLQRRRLQRQTADAFCTSTPRKSRSYYDRQRLIGTVFSDEEQIEVVDNSGEQTTPHLSNGALLALTQGNTRRITVTPTTKRQARLPLYLHGNGTPKLGISGERMRQRRKMNRERMARFDQDRPLDQVRLSDRISCSGRPSQILMGNTVVLDDGRGRRSVVGVTFKVDDSLQLEVQQFEADNMSKWTPGNESSEVGDCRFEELCKRKASAAPFHVQPTVGVADLQAVECSTLFRTFACQEWQRVILVVSGLSVVVALFSLLVRAWV
ncbi:putative leucine-rich repeat-containing protein DDB_G0290503 isoform X2 [Drosophila kikkawai]|uniref:Leucine-rich repeat-containing protein DDB_G0290503 isoform X2 n=1 Tax=Drosophila kikkawai TaxID=30033 RepID=A0A6P4IVJ9_DROKI|nr:early endosome antigen 1 isoform X2 [Drosophila kikkawai]